MSTKNEYGKTYRIERETLEKVMKLWRTGLDYDEDLKASEIINYVLSQHIDEHSIEEIIKNRHKKWSRRK